MLEGIKYIIVDNHLKFIVTKDFDKYRNKCMETIKRDEHSPLTIRWGSYNYPEITKPGTNLYVVCLPGNNPTRDGELINLGYGQKKLTKDEFDVIMRLIGIPPYRRNKITLNTRRNY